MDRPPGHAFVSYVREDAERVDWLCEQLELAGIRVWRDTKDLWPGEDWRSKIREAITSNALVFIGCFSNESENKEVSYQREELILAAEQMRLRRPGRSWLIPVRFDEVDVPNYPLGADRNLNSLHRLDLLTNTSPNLGRLIASVTTILVDPKTAASPSSERADAAGRRSGDSGTDLRRILLDPQRALDVEDLVLDAVSEVRATTANRDRFPTTIDRSDVVKFSRAAAAQANDYFEVARPLIELLITGVASGSPDHHTLWARAIRTIAPPTESLAGGQQALVSLQNAPLFVAIYASAISAVDRERFGALKAVTLDARIRNREGQSIPGIEFAHPYVTFRSEQLIGDVLAIEADGSTMTDEQMLDRTRRGGWRYTPFHDWLFVKLRPLFSRQIPDEDDYLETFTRVELFLGAIATDAETFRGEGDAWLNGPSFGSFTWRQRYFRNGPEDGLLQEAKAAGQAWPPVVAGLFGGEADRAVGSLTQFATDAKRSRQHRF